MDEKQNVKSYNVMQLKMVYQRILEALDEKRKRDISVAVRSICEPLDVIDEILRIEAEYNTEINKWSTILRIDEINKKDRELFDKAFGSMDDILKNSSFKRT